MVLLGKSYPPITRMPVENPEGGSKVEDFMGETKGVAEFFGEKIKKFESSWGSAGICCRAVWGDPRRNA
jgi:hypothetical protein